MNPEHQYRHDNIAAEVFTDGQIRFIESTETDAENRLLYNPRTASGKVRMAHAGYATASRIEQLFEREDVEEFFNRGAQVLAQNGVAISTEAIGYPELAGLYEEISSRDELSVEDVRPEMLIAHMKQQTRLLSVNLSRISTVRRKGRPGYPSFTYGPNGVSVGREMFFMVDKSGNVASVNGCKTSASRRDREITRHMLNDSKLVAATVDDLERVNQFLPLEVQLRD